MSSIPRKKSERTAAIIEAEKVRLRYRRSSRKRTRCEETKTNNADSLANRRFNYGTDSRPSKKGVDSPVRTRSNFMMSLYNAMQQHKQFGAREQRRSIMVQQFGRFSSIRCSNWSNFMKRYNSNSGSNSNSSSNSNSGSSSSGSSNTSNTSNSRHHLPVLLVLAVVEEKDVVQN